MRKIGLAMFAGGLLALAGCTSPQQTGGSGLALSGVVNGSNGILTMNGKVLDLSSARVTLNGEAATAAVVKAGMEISGSGTEDNGKVRLREVEARYRAKGQADQVDVAGGFIVVAGLKALITPNTRIFEDDSETPLTLADLAAGNYLKVAGIPQPNDPNDVIVATRVERETEDNLNRVELFVPIRNLDETRKTFTYGLKTYTVDYSKAEVRGVLKEGGLVRFRGTKAEGSISAERVRAAEGKDKPEVPDGTRIELKGLVGGLNATAKTFQIEGLSVDYSTAEVRGTLADGVMVEVKGTLSGTSVKAVRVKVEDERDDEGEKPGEAELEGPIADFNGTAQTFTVNGITVSVNAQTKYEQDDEGVGEARRGEDDGGDHLTAQEFWGTDRTGKMVEVKGTATSATAVLARKIELK